MSLSPWCVYLPCQGLWSPRWRSSKNIDVPNFQISLERGPPEKQDTSYSIPPASSSIHDTWWASLQSRFLLALAQVCLPWRGAINPKVDSWWRLWKLHRQINHGVQDDQTWVLLAHTKERFDCVCSGVPQVPGLHSAHPKPAWRARLCV